MKSTVLKAVLFVGSVAVVLGTFPATVGHASPKSQQVIFSVANVPGAFSYTAPLPAPADNHFGFWIWCQAPGSNNNYNGVCNGSMYFYGLGVTRPVGGSVTELSTGIYTMSVVSSDNEIVCSLTNEVPFSGTGSERQTIDASCPPSGVAPGVIQGTGTAADAVVNVTGN